MTANPATDRALADRISVNSYHTTLQVTAAAFLDEIVCLTLREKHNQHYHMQLCQVYYIIIIYEHAYTATKIYCGWTQCAGGQWNYEDCVDEIVTDESGEERLQCSNMHVMIFHK